MRLAWVPLSLAILLFASNAQAASLSGYGWFDVGGLIAVPADGSGNEFGAGFAVSGGMELGDLIQLGGRSRFAVTSQRICTMDSTGQAPCGYDWGGGMLTLGLELRLRTWVAARWVLAVGGSVSVGAWGGCVRGDYCGGGGANLAVDVRIQYRLRRRLGVHLAFELQQQNGMGNGVDRLAISTFWAGLGW